MTVRACLQMSKKTVRSVRLSVSPPPHMLVRGSSQCGARCHCAAGWRADQRCRFELRAQETKTNKLKKTPQTLLKCARELARAFGSVCFFCCCCFSFPCLTEVWLALATGLHFMIEPSALSTGAFSRGEARMRTAVRCAPKYEGWGS